MHILFVNSATGLGGGLTSALDLATGLADGGHLVTMVCHPKSEILWNIRDDSRIEAVPLGIRAEANLWRVVQLRQVIHRVNPDVVLADKRKDVKFSFLARGGGALPAIVHRHGAPSPLRDGAVYRFIWPRLQGVVVNSKAMKEELLRRTPWLSTVPLTVVYNGKDLDRYRPRPELRAVTRKSLGIAQDAFVACFHGAFLARKRVADLIHASARLGGRLAVHVLAIGEGPEGAGLRALAGKSGIQATFTGSRDDIPELLSAADVAVNLSESEGFSNSVVEALASGLPVIASDAHSHPEQVVEGSTGRLVPVGDVDALCNALLEHAAPGVLAERGPAARDHAVASFGLDRMVSAYEEVLRTACRRA